jgi:hypothetical protein
VGSGPRALARLGVATYLYLCLFQPDVLMVDLRVAVECAAGEGVDRSQTARHEQPGGAMLGALQGRRDAGSMPGLL